MADQLKPGMIEALIDKLEKTIEGLDKAGIAEWVELFRNPGRMLYLNFLAGVARGFGIAIGFSVVGAAFALVLTRVARLNLPIIGEFIADIARIVRLEMQVP